MSTQIATFTVSSFHELKSIKRLHPKRVIMEGDLCLLSGGENNDDICFFSAHITDYPITSLPSSVGSYDGRIQWNMVSNGYFSGGVPAGLEQDGLIASPTPLWEVVSINPPFIRSCGAVRELWPSLYQGFSCDKIDDNVWIVTTNITKLNLSTGETTLYPVGTLPDGNTELCNNGRCIAKDTGTIHLIGDDKSHSVFDIVTGVMSYAAKSPIPYNYASTALFIDASQESGKLFFFSIYTYPYGTPYPVYRYNISTNTWSGIIFTFPQSPNAVIPDITRPGKFLVLVTNNTVYSFDPVAETFTLLYTLSGLTVCTEGGAPTSAVWDTVTGECCVFNDIDGYFLDPSTGATRSSVGFLPKYSPIYLCAACAVGDGVYFVHDRYDPSYRLIKVTPSFRMRKIR
jgi:hypothetical protein